MRRTKLSSLSFRTLAAAAVLSVGPVVVAAAPASALAIGQTVCYTSDGSPVVNPPSEDGYEYCFTRPAGSGGGGGPVLCTISSTSYSCTPLQPLQG